MPCVQQIPTANQEGFQEEVIVFFKKYILARGLRLLAICIWTLTIPLDLGLRIVYASIGRIGREADALETNKDNNELV